MAAERVPKSLLNGWAGRVVHTHACTLVSVLVIIMTTSFMYCSADHPRDWNGIERC